MPCRPFTPYLPSILTGGNPAWQVQLPSPRRTGDPSPPLTGRSLTQFSHRHWVRTRTKGSERGDTYPAARGKGFRCVDEWVTFGLQFYPLEAQFPYL